MVSFFVCVNLFFLWDFVIKVLLLGKAEIRGHVVLATIASTALAISMWYAPESSLVTSPPFTSPSATALCVYSTIGELKTMSLWGGP